MVAFVWSGTNIVYEETGPGDAVPMIFVHGWTANRHRWDAQVRDLAKGYRCIRLDLPGHGESGPPPSGYEISGLADCVLALADHLGLDTFVLVGHSMGGMAALSLTLDYPSRVRELVLVDSIAVMAYSPWRAFLLWLSGFLPFDMFITLNIRRAFARGFPRTVVDKYVAQARSGSPAVVRGFFAAMRRFDVLERVDEIGCPVVIVHGYRDIQLPLSQALRMAVGMTHESIRVIDCGHESPVEAPDAVTASIRDLIKTPAKQDVPPRHDTDLSPQVR